jgi:carboxylesterase type B
MSHEDQTNTLGADWPACDANTRATMVFDANTRVVNDPRSAIRTYWSEHA